MHLLRIRVKWAAVSRDVPLAVTEERNTYAACPRCDKSLEQDYTPFCPYCGQRLNWNIWWNRCEGWDDE